MKRWVCWGVLGMCGLAVLAQASEKTPQAQLIVEQMLDSRSPQVRQQVRKLLEAQGLAAASLVDRVYPRLKTRGGRWACDAVLAELRARIRRRALSDSGRAYLRKSVLPVTAKLSARSTWRLGIGRTPEGHGVVYFDAKTFPRLVWGMERLKILEYLVCPDPAPRGIGSKSYESLAGMTAKNLAAFAEACRKGRAIWLRWTGQSKGVPLKTALPWARPGKFSPKTGLGLGGQHDEAANKRLPPHKTQIQIGVVLPK